MHECAHGVTRGGADERGEETVRDETEQWKGVDVSAMPKAAEFFFHRGVETKQKPRRRRVGTSDEYRFHAESVEAAEFVSSASHSIDVARVARVSAGGGYFSKEFMKSDYDAGRHMYFTGATSMGLCGTIDAPCAHITVLRDPMERMWKRVAYLCLEGGEGHLSWTAEEREKSSGEGCPLDPVEWYAQKRSTAAQLTGLLAPRGGHTACGAEAAKANLCGRVRAIRLSRRHRGRFEENSRASSRSHQSRARRR